MEKREKTLNFETAGSEEKKELSLGRHIEYELTLANEA